MNFQAKLCYWIYNYEACQPHTQAEGAVKLIGKGRKFLPLERRLDLRGLRIQINNLFERS